MYTGSYVCPMINENRKLTAVAMPIPRERVSVLCISEGICKQQGIHEVEQCSVKNVFTCLRSTLQPIWSTHAGSV